MKKIYIPIFFIFCALFSFSCDAGDGSANGGDSVDDGGGAFSFRYCRRKNRDANRAGNGRGLEFRKHA